MKTPMEDPRQTEDLLTAAADHPRLHLTLRRRSVTIRFLGTCEPPSPLYFVERALRY